jgi:hypothetical protein
MNINEKLVAVGIGIFAMVIFATGIVIIPQLLNARMHP